MGSSDGSFDGSNYNKPEGLFIGDSLGCTDDEVLGYYEGIKLRLSDKISWHYTWKY